MANFLLAPCVVDTRALAPTQRPRLVSTFRRLVPTLHKDPNPDAALPTARFGEKNSAMQADDVIWCGSPRASLLVNRS